jgi:hypothetical protein
MARSKLDTVIYATILLAPLATAIGYIALTPAPEPVIVTIPAIAQVAPTTAPAPQTIEPPIAAPEPSIAAPEPSIAAPEPIAVQPPAAPVDAGPSITPEPGAAVLLHERQLLLSTAAEPSWATGKLRAHPLEYGLAASKAVDPTRLPAELQPLVGARFIVHAADGSSCTAEAGTLSLYAREDGIDYDFDDVDENGEPRQPSPAQLLAARKGIFEDAHLLFARLAGNARCNGLWARRADLPTPTVFTSVALDEAADAALKTQVLAILETQPAIVALHTSLDAFRAEYQRNYEEPNELTWAEILASLKVSRWDELGGSRKLVNVEIGLGDQGCGDYFTDEAALMFTIEGDRLQPHADGGFLRPNAVMDLERDGHLEAVTTSGQTIETRGPATGHQSYEFPYNGCRC